MQKYILRFSFLLFFFFVISFFFVSRAHAAQLTLQADSANPNVLHYTLVINTTDIEYAGLYQDNDINACTIYDDCTNVFIHLEGEVEDGCTGIQTDCSGGGGASSWDVYSAKIPVSTALSGPQTGTITLSTNYLTNVTATQQFTPISLRYCNGNTGTSISCQNSFEYEPIDEFPDYSAFGIQYLPAVFNSYNLQQDRNSSQFIDSDDLNTYMVTNNDPFNDGSYIPTPSPTPTPSPSPTPTPSPTTLQPTADSFLNYYEQNQNEGSNPALKIEQSFKGRVLVKFDENQIQQAVGEDPHYTATLLFTITDNGNNWGTGKQVELDRLFQDWSEGNGYVNGNSTPDRGTGSGVTWKCASDSNISNNTKDCTTANTWDMTNAANFPFSSSPTATTLITNHQTGTVSLDVTSDVQAFLNGNNQNYGWILKRTDESTTGKVYFGSKESGNEPILIITPQ